MIAIDSKYATNSNLLNEAIDNFITACVKDGTIIPTGNWGNKNIDWNSIINEFANSIYKIDLDNKLSGGDKKEQLRAIWPENPFDSALEEGSKTYTFEYAAQFTEELESDVKIEYAIDVITGADLGVQVSVIDSKTGNFNLRPRCCF